LYYLHHVSWWLDVRILICTGFSVLGGPFHRLSRYLLPSREKVVAFYHGLRARVDVRATVAGGGVPIANGSLTAVGHAGANGHSAGNGVAAVNVQVFERA
jgi:hypothetical protein